MSSTLNAAYNNFLTAYTPKSLTRYDTHKKSELRSVYNSIVKLNKDAPWYLPTTNRETQHYAIDIKENARTLHNTIAQIGGMDEGDILSQKSAYSSDEGTISATFIGDAQSGNEIPTLEMEVHSLATSQENLGKFLPNSKVALAPDTYSFDIGINDMNYEFQFSVGESETNRDIQERLVRLINNANIGLSAELMEAENGTSLKLTSDATGLYRGRNQIFTVSDDQTSKRAGTVDYLGLDYVSREAADANFTINGEERSASSNHFTIGKLFEVELKNITEDGEPVQIGLKTDIESLADNVTHLLGSYNAFLKAAATYSDVQIRGKQLAGELTGIAKHFQSSLETIGITAEEDGTLQLNREQLRHVAVESEDMSESFDALRHFSGSLLRKSDQVSLNPMNYVERTVVAYKNPGHNYVSPYNSSSYSGMMFNYYC